MSSMPNVVLPSIHEMFPEHLMKDSHHPRSISHRRESRPSTSQGMMDVDYPSGSSAMRRHTVESVPNSSPRVAAAHPSHPSGSSVKGDYGPPLRHHSHRAHKSQSSSPIFSFDVLRSDPSSSSLQHIASSATYPNRGGSSSGYSSQAPGEPSSGSVFRVAVADHGSTSAIRNVGQSRPPRINDSRKPDGESTRPTSAPRYSAGVISFPAGPIAGVPRNRPRSPNDHDAGSDDDMSGSNNGKKHVCSTCFKRFNRPSSLRIHVNTHTGATPFRCPWPNCAREFNVNSNMRRHYRNHTSPGVPRPQAVDNRRRRKQGSPHNLVFIPGDPRSESVSANSPTSHRAMDEGSDDSEDGNYHDDEDEELDSLPDQPSPVYPTSQQPLRKHVEHLDREYGLRPSFNRYSQSHVRSGHPDSSTSSSSSSSPSPPIRNYTYSPSAPYSRSFTDSKVSTALRPAFHSKPVLAPSLGVPMSDIR